LIANNLLSGANNLLLIANNLLSGANNLLLIANNLLSGANNLLLIANNLLSGANNLLLIANNLLSGANNLLLRINKPLLVIRNLLLMNKKSHFLQKLQAKLFNHVWNNAPSDVQNRAERKIKFFIYRMFSENSRNEWLRSELSRIENHPPDPRRIPSQKKKIRFINRLLK
jgi:hypothetical protein